MATNLENKISRVATNVTDALAAIAAKGVDITGMNSDDLAALIGLISGTEDLTAELEAQDAIITELEEAVANKAAGSGEPPNIQPLTVTENGTYTVSGDVDGYSPITVNVPEKEPVLVELVAEANGTYNPPDGIDGYSSVEVYVPSSGGSIDACTLTVALSDNGMSIINKLVLNKVVDGKIVLEESAKTGTFTVPCNSIVYMYGTGGGTPKPTHSDNVTLINNLYSTSHIYLYKMPSVAGSTATITHICS